MSKTTTTEKLAKTVKDARLARTLAISSMVFSLLALIGLMADIQQTPDINVNLDIERLVQRATKPVTTPSAIPTPTTIPFE